MNHRTAEANVTQTQTKPALNRLSPHLRTHKSTRGCRRPTQLTPLSFLSDPTLVMFASVKAAAGEASELRLLSPQTGTCPATSGPQRASLADRAAKPDARVVGREIKSLSYLSPVREIHFPTITYMKCWRFHTIFKYIFIGLLQPDYLSLMLSR